MTNLTETQNEVSSVIGTEQKPGSQSGTDFVPVGSAVDAFDPLESDFIESIWKDLGGKVPPEEIQQAVADVSSEFQDARITQFVPIFVRRRAIDQLKRS